MGDFETLSKRFNSTIFSKEEKSERYKLAALEKKFKSHAEKLLNLPPQMANSCVKRANTPLFRRTLIDSNVNALADIYDIQTKKFIPHEKLLEYHGPVIDIVIYNSIKTATPRTWLIEMKNDRREPGTTYIDTTRETKCKNKSF